MGLTPINPSSIKRAPLSGTRRQSQPSQLNDGKAPTAAFKMRAGNKPSIKAAGL